MGQGGGDGQLHAHSAGIVPEGFVRRKIEAAEDFVKARRVPVSVAAAHHAVHVSGVEQRGKAGFVQHDAHVLFDVDEFRRRWIDAQHADVAAVPRRGVHDEVDERALARAVFPDQAEYAAPVSYTHLRR